MTEEYVNDNVVSIEKAILADVCFGIPLGKITFSLPSDIDAASLAYVPDTFLFRGEHLGMMKALYDQGDDQMTRVVEELVRLADEALRGHPFAVTDKPKSRFSDDPHDYQSLAKYSWPNPETGTGLPFVTRDGEVNPDCYGEDLDYIRLVRFSERIVLLALAAYLTGKATYGRRGAELLRTWFVDPQTRQTPHFRFAQISPGRKGLRWQGIIEARFLVYVTEAIQLLAATGALAPPLREEIRVWFATLLDWLLESEHGQKAADARNNIGFWYDLQCMVYAQFCGKAELAEQIARERVATRLHKQLTLDGALPAELTRSYPQDYVAFTLAAMALIARTGERSGLGLWTQREGDGRNFQAAHDWLLKAGNARQLLSKVEPAGIGEEGGAFHMGILLEMGIKLRAAHRVAEIEARAAAGAKAELARARAELARAKAVRRRGETEIATLKQKLEAGAVALQSEQAEAAALREARDSEIAALNQKLEASLVALQSEQAEAAAVREARDAEITALKRKLRDTEQSRVGLEGERQALRAALAADRKALQKYGGELEKRYKAVLTSTSWQAMGPFRVVMRNVKSLLTGRRYGPNRLPKIPQLSSGLAARPAEARPKRSAGGATSRGRPKSAEPKWPQGVLKTDLGAMTETALRRTYDRLPERARAALPRAAKEFVKKRSLSKDRALSLVKKYDDKLWGGFSRSALIDLAAIKANESLPARDRAEACYSLARWHAVQGDFAAALQEMEDRREIDPKVAHLKRQYMLEALFLCRLGRAEEARTLVERHSAGGGFDTSVQLMLANTWNPAVTGVQSSENEAKVLEHINTVYRHFGLAEIEKRDPCAPLSIDNLRGKDVKKHFDPENKVTVIVPAYNAEDTILTALTSLTEQSWQNLQVLVVDDCSTDNTAEVVEAFCKTDERVKLIRQGVNGGSYACRNRALEEACGKFVTIHDSDDWAHPDRIRFHAIDLLDKQTVCNLSKWVRTSCEMFFVGVWRPQEELTNLNMGSFFLERSVFEKVGKWDGVRISGDREFICRVETYLGERSRKTIVDGCPLVFGRVSETSLTQSKDTSVSSVYNGIRREYHEASDFFHKKYENALRSGFYNKGIKIPAPGIMKVDRNTPDLNVLLVGDWNMQGGAFQSAMNIAMAGINNGFRIGVLNYPRYDYDVSRPLSYGVRNYFYENGLMIISPGEEVRADTVIFTYPAILTHAMDRFPSIAHNRLVVVVNQMAERDIKGKDVAYDPLRVRQQLVEFFGNEGDWVPISARVRKLMENDRRYPRPHQDTWTPMTDVQGWFAAHTPHWRGRARERPVIGRHGRDHKLKWPGDVQALREAYGVGRPCEMRFLGGARHAEKLIGHLPANWQVGSFGSQDVKEFLADLDFFIHYPHEDYIEEFGRAPMEAMAIGVPVILPPVFKDTFGEAALYAEPKDVWQEIERLWADGGEWLSRVEVGRAFVEANCSYDRLLARLQSKSPIRRS